MKYLVIFLALLGSLAGLSQTGKIDTLLAREQRAATRNEKLDVLLELFEEHQSLNRDTLYDLALEARQLAAAQTNAEKKALADLALANAYMQWGWLDSALATIEPDLANGEAYPKSTYFKISRAKAMYYGSRSELEKSLSLLYASLAGAEKSGDTLNIAAIMNSIGSINIARGKQDEALLWILRAVSLSANASSRKGVLAAAFTNAAYAYLNKGLSDSSLYFIKQAIPVCRKIENLYILATALRIYSALLTGKKQFSEAEAALKEMIRIRNLTSGAAFFLEDNLQLADFYANTGQLDKAIEFCKANLMSGNVYDVSGTGGVVYTNDPKIRLEYFQALAKYYKLAGRNGEYEATLEQIIDLKDSFYTANSAQAMAEAEAKYNVQKKENTILQQKYILQRDHFYLFGSFALTAMLLLIAYLFFRDYRIKQKLKMELALAEGKRNALMAVKEAEEKERVRIAADLHDNLGAYAASLSSNLTYIQPGDADEKTKQAFHELKNNSASIISELNDTIWVLKKETLTLTAISDRIKLFINRIKNSYPEIDIDVMEDIEQDVPFQPSQAFHLYRIMQEALTNALKHSKSKHITINIIADRSWTIAIQDDGTGMNSFASATEGGNGLANMKRRANESGWHIEWLPGTDSGTAVIICPNTN